MRFLLIQFSKNAQKTLCKRKQRYAKARRSKIEQKCYQRENRHADEPQAMLFENGTFLPPAYTILYARNFQWDFHLSLLKKLKSFWHATPLVGLRTFISKEKSGVAFGMKTIRNKPASTLCPPPPLCLPLKMHDNECVEVHS